MARTPLEERFAQWWATYPRRVGKLAAWRVWQRLKPSEALVAQMRTAVATQQRSGQWQKDGGRYIPYPRRWLLEERWLDETPDPAAPVLTPGEARDFAAHYRRMLGQYCRHDPVCESSQDCKRRQLQAWVQARRGE